jgi:hypothetical protein
MDSYVSWGNASRLYRDIRTLCRNIVKEVEGGNVMKKLLLLAIVFCLLLFSATQVSAACTTTVPAGGDIQAAITTANAGDVICLSPGIYTPSATININKSITLQGPQAGVDPCPSYGSTRNPSDSFTEAIVTGSITLFNIAANNVEINGLTMESSINNSGLNIVQDNSESFISDGAKVLYNIIHNTNYATGAMNEAVKIRTGTNPVIAYNYIYNIPSPGDGINFDRVTNGTIEHNELHDQGSENAAIYVYGSQYTTIKCNLVYNTLLNEAIKLGAKGGADALLSGGQIIGNITHDTKQDGIAIYTSNVLVDSNEVYKSTSENGAIYVAYGISNITITNNFLHDNTLTTPKWGNPGAIMIGTDVNAATVKVNNNNITGNSPNGLTNKAAASLNGENNWWGAANGPSGSGSGSEDKVSTNVDFDPWLTAAQAIQNICIPPNNPPVARCKDVAVSAGSDCKAMADINNGSSDPDGDPITLSQSPGGLYPMGNTLIILTVTDDKGASDSCQATVTVVDDAPPLITCPANITVEFTDPSGAVVNYAIPIANDNCGISSTSCTPGSGSKFPIGTTLVTCTATDTSSKTASCTFNVTVLGPQGVKRDVIDDLNALLAGPTTGADKDRLNDAMRHMIKSLKPSLWKDGNHLVKKTGETVFNKEKACVVKLIEIYKDPKSKVDKPTLLAIIRQIVTIDQTLATIAYNEAVAYGTKPAENAAANKELDRANSLFSAGKYPDSIEHYKKAWEHGVKSYSDP